ncbi:NAD(+) synthase [Luteolibacter luteus]|uniref:Glutamine-dependent NAD(+) synthetase n=1 Tax=Luteolibacter luteus TaxID=2728835 RepID=A0A858RLB2_9BACT|nr:NAD(+) synthase [Luteolibacter luteus]QJE96970.1 NAD(+) synthase [Luteolibacter luteus]
MPFSRYGFLRLAVCVPEVEVAAVEANTRHTIAALEKAAAAGAQLAVFPELGITGYSCADLFYQKRLLDAAEQAVKDVADACGRLGIAAVVGLPARNKDRLYNVAAVIGANGKLAGMVVKTHLPTNHEFYERRWFATAFDLPDGGEISFLGGTVPFGADLLFPVEEWPDCVLGVEICEDLWSVIPPSSSQAVAGANVLLNLSASNELLGKVGYRRDLVRQQSARCLAAYAYCSAGPGESTTDIVYSGHSLICENGGLLAETERLSFDVQVAVADIDVGKLHHERLVSSSYRESTTRSFRRVELHLKPWREKGGLLRRVDPRPFVPADPQRRTEHCEEIFRIQTVGLAKRLRHTKCKGIVLGLSGGLDSTLAALVAVRAFDLVGMDRKQIVAITMPGMGTTDRTRDNSVVLAEMLGLTLREIVIREAVEVHFRDIGHPPDLHDVTFENSQARERTQILMDVANQIGGFVLGTGDLSELALGWCTFNGDHMSMYHANAGVPKTLVRHLVEWCAEEVFRGPEAAVLHDIAATPISPELLPPDKEGKIVQQTEEVVGPYSLHDFFLFQFVRLGFPPDKIRYLAEIAFDGEYSPEVIAKWLDVFIRRFFSQQFKRNAMPDGPKVGSVALSPRGDWRMPSDSVSQSWLD